MENPEDHPYDSAQFFLSFHQLRGSDLLYLSSGAQVLGAIRHAKVKGELRLYPGRLVRCRVRPWGQVPSKAVCSV